jgi:hypothetical protein
MKNETIENRFGSFPTQLNEKRDFSLKGMKISQQHKITCNAPKRGDGI